MLLGYLKSKIGLILRRREWRRRNPGNSTVPVNGFDFDNVTVGNYTYGPLTVLNFNVGQKLKIGSFCSIASDVVFMLNGDHPTDRISTFPFRAKCLNTAALEGMAKDGKGITVDDDVWIGQGAMILSGVHIGQGAVIGAGAVVTKDVPPYAVAAGVPPG